LISTVPFIGICEKNKRKRWSWHTRDDILAVPSHSSCSCLLFTCSVQCTCSACNVLCSMFTQRIMR